MFVLMVMASRSTSNHPRMIVIMWSAKQNFFLSSRFSPPFSLIQAETGTLGWFSRISKRYSVLIELPWIIVSRSIETIRCSLLHRAVRFHQGLLVNHRVCASMHQHSNRYKASTMPRIWHILLPLVRRIETKINYAFVVADSCRTLESYAAKLLYFPLKRGRWISDFGRKLWKGCITPQSQTARRKANLNKKVSRGNKYIHGKSGCEDVDKISLHGLFSL